MEPVVEDCHVRPDDEPGDVERPFGGVVSADDLEDGRALGDLEPGCLGAGGHPGGDLLLDLQDRGDGVDAGDVAARTSPGDQVGIAFSGGEGEVAVGGLVNNPK